MAGTVVLAPLSTSITAGNTGLFTCVGLGVPPLSISWTRANGTELRNGSQVNIYNSNFEEGGMVFFQSVLEICGVVDEDGGQYTCTVANNIGSSNSSFEVEVTPTGTVSLGLYLSVCPSACLSVCLSVCLSLFSFTCQSDYLLVFFFLSVCLSVCLC